MSNRYEGLAETDRQALSALMDGHGGDGDAGAACALWRGRAEARECWSTYHLIGDVMRSDELASPQSTDEAFLAELHDRLSKEPVPLMPARRTAPGWRRASMAAAAGFVAVAGVLVVLRSGGFWPGDGAASRLAKSEASEGMPAQGRLIRDSQLDRYLAAHRRVTQAVSMAVPGGVVRSVDVAILEEVVEPVSGALPVRQQPGASASVMSR